MSKIGKKDFRLYDRSQRDAGKRASVALNPCSTRVGYAFHLACIVSLSA